MAAPGDTKVRRAVYADLERVPDTMVAEIVDGELFASPRPRPRHAVAASVLGSDLNPPFQQGRGGPGGWWILFEPELHFGEDVLVPDIAGWRRERLPAPPAVAHLALAPDWLCEVLSPSTEAVDRAKKLKIYAREGVSHVWLIDPLLRTLEVLRLESQRWALIAMREKHALVRAEPFDAIELELGALWE